MMLFAGFIIFLERTLSAIHISLTMRRLCACPGLCRTEDIVHRRRYSHTYCTESMWIDVPWMISFCVFCAVIIVVACLWLCGWISGYSFFRLLTFLSFTVITSLLCVGYKQICVFCQTGYFRRLQSTIVLLQANGWHNGTGANDHRFIPSPVISRFTAILFII